MHILLIHQAFAGVDEPGGTRHHEFARRFLQQGHAVTVITGQASYLTGQQRTNSRWIERERDEFGVEIIRCRSLASWHDSFPARVVNFISFMLMAFFTGLRVPKVDLIWATTPPMFQAISSMWIAGLRRKPLLLEVRDLWPYFAIEVGVLTNPVLIRISSWMERVLYRRSDMLVINSPGYLEHVKQRGAGRVELVPNGVDSAMFAVTSRGNPLREALSLGDAFIVLYTGAHGMSNDLGKVLDAASILRDHVEIQFVLLGDGKEKPVLEQAARKRRLENVHFTAPVPKSQIGAWMADADACLAILRAIPAYKTTYPNKVFDYMAAGKPVILAIDGVIREVVERAGCGIYAQPGDAQAIAQAVLTLAGDRGSAASMGRAGKTYVQEHFERIEQAGVMLNLMLELQAQAPHQGDPAHG
jgi:glycosyltransferase involved in cell wall biosynthesis